MTLSTNIYVLDEIWPLEVFTFCQGLLAKYDDRPGGPHPQEYRDEQQDSYVDGEWVVRPGSPWRIGNRLGQGLPAILDVEYRVGAPLRTEEQAREHFDDCDADCEEEHDSHACWLDVDFDTAYGYHDDAGRGCGDLHALLVSELGQWLDSKSVRWSWCNEYTGEVHGGPDRYERLIDLARGGFEASAWMRTTVLPAIVASFATAPDDPSSLLGGGS